MNNYPTYKLGDICVIERGGSPRPIKDYLTKDDNGLNWIKIGDATLSNKYIYTTAEKIKPEGLSKTRMVESGDLILSNSMSFGRPYIMRTSGCIHDGWVVFRLNKDIIDEEYLYNILNSSKVYAQFNHLATGSTVKNLNIDRVKEVVIPLPPLPTQHLIVSRIESLFAELDKAVEHLRTAQQQIKTYRQAVLNHWLNNDEGKWEIVKLGEVAKKIQIGPFGTQLHKSDYISGGIPLINPMHISNNKIMPDKSFSVSEEKYKELSNYYLQKDDVILGRRGEMGRCAVVSENEDGMLCGTGSLYIRGGSAFCADYLCKLLSSQKIIMYFENASSGTTMSNLNRGIIENCEIPFPTLSEQQRIVAEIESRLSQAEAVEASIEKALQQSEALRQSILKKAFEGELV